MLVDLDRFKVVNDSLGHDVGDGLLRQVADALAINVRSGDTVARLGGDEFVVLATDMMAEDVATVLANKLLTALSRPMHAAGHELISTGSMGIAVFPRDGRSARELLKNADVAMYRAKEIGGNRFAFHSPEMNARLLERLSLEKGLRGALERHQLELHYQPKVELAGGTVVGAEALLRWRHPELGVVSPGAFIPLAEETGLIMPIGAWAIDEACRQIKEWREAGMGNVTVAVNISARQFQQDGLTDVVAGALAAYGVEAPNLELEVTESAVMGNAEAAAGVLRTLKATGVKISLDDFGTGYSSLSYLKRYPIDTLKIDQSFVRDISTDPDDAAIARLVIALGHDLGCQVIAEGVETQAQLDFLREQGCDQIQGYLFSRPLSAGAFTDLLAEGRRLPLGK
jgi:diguanylate cyclase (GGDEF)-like protein